MTYQSAVKFLYSLGNEVKAAKLGLERMAALLDALGRPERGRAFVHVAGTNGKGSTCAMIESGLRAAGVRTGLYTSPHLSEPTERIRIAGLPVSREQFSTAFECVHEAAERLIAAGELEAHPTYFETVTAMALVLFRDLGAEITVLEVGLGGRLDATNMVTPRLAVITPVDFDHERFLGRGLTAIANEKAGILKSGVPVVFAAQRPEVAGTLSAHASALGIEPIWTSGWKVRDLDLSPSGSRFVAVGPKEIPIECPLAGEHQVENALTAIAALDALGFPPEAIAAGIRQTRWPGRLERVSENPVLILDGAHNPAGARALARYIERFYRDRRVWLIYGAMRDKAVTEMAGILFPLAGEVILTSPAQARAVRCEALRELVDHPHLRAVPQLEEALALARREAAPGDAIFIAGSLYLVGEARALLGLQ
ncbi:MAG TPA: folylpolyglutamate synthase/dihydrofolate synthase family protein [Bryobacteraceae bacterium]|nr:folylpolyglutamate synthase/dihydrofolate synthase family protein [Bryobacteraceae bacterium]HOQ47080.1 folylpolyglutamate synthase/dihydrofolate synthase family protein [Bryobacteraceae bacterium]HPQ13744.1 folylpolyglutamate synthase/dihydrofolate synthase family protein [Bryobacteraceae bacterium]HPU71047.1 folylpolyglutamate synthase/dihydrofolate synthase family protein [Bryobacteraceae bacterium]